MAKVKVIPQTINPMTMSVIGSTQKRKVAAYARVSTENEEQQSSYEAQVKYYTEHIATRPDWEFVKVYSDEGISGTNTKRRVGFRSMIQDAVDGKIDLILTKSISRFARNTLDSISYIRQLKAAGTEVYFEKENLWTFDSKSEMVLSMLSAIAQEESRSISENVKMGKRWQMKEGKVTIPCKAFLGYQNIDGKITIDKDEAIIVRRIYSMFLKDGMTRKAIADTLKAEEIPTPSKKGCNWTVNNIQSILTNEKYKGDALLQKVYCDDYLEHKVKKNNGVLPQYYVENSHPGIINKEEWTMVQEELKRREGIRYSYQTSNPYLAKLRCAECGHFYGIKVWHSNSIHRKEVLQCNGKYKCGCKSPNLSQDEVNRKFIEAYNQVMDNKKGLIEDTKEVIEMLTSTEEIDSKVQSLTNEMEEVQLLVENLIHDNSRRNQDQEEYERHYQELVSQFNAAKARMESLLEEKQSKLDRIEILNAFIASLEDKETVIDEFSTDLWNLMIQDALVNEDGTIKFVFKNGTEIAK